MTQVSRVSQVKFIQKGETGNPGPLLYPAGVWYKETPYIRTEDTAPFVWHEEVYYYLAKEGECKGVNPKEDYKDNGKKGHWIEIKDHTAVYAKILMADFALVGGAVFHKEKMMSQQGANSNYKDFQVDANDKPTGKFDPNFYVDLKTGYLQANNVNLKGKIEATSGSFAGKISATQGSIGGFRISGNGLTNENEQGRFIDDAYVIFRNDTHGCFAGIGGNVLPASGVYRGVARFENHDSSDWFGMGRINYSTIISARNALTNIALLLNGGCIAGFAEKVQVVDKSCTIDITSTCIICVNTSEITLDLPTMQAYDDGHVVEIKVMNDKASVKVRPGSGYQIEYKNNQYVTTFRSTYMHVNSGEHVTYSKPLTLKSQGDASKFVYARQVNNGTQYGCWVQFKNPRDW